MLCVCSLYFSLLKNRLRRAFEEHRAKRRHMEIYYNVPQGSKVTDKQQHSYRDDDERMDWYLTDALQHINRPHKPQTGGRQLQRMDYLPFDGDSDSEEEEEKEEDTREVVRRL